MRRNPHPKPRTATGAREPPIFPNKVPMNAHGTRGTSENT